MAKLSYRQLMRTNPVFRRVWLGEVVSYLGDWFTTIALYTMVQSLTDSALAVAGVLIAKTLPVFLMSPISGPLIDRTERRFLLVGTNLARAVCMLGIIAAWMMESLPLIFLILIVSVCFTGIFLPTRGAVLPQITTEEELPVAMALGGGTWSVMLALGAAIGGFVTEIVGVEWSLLIDVLTFLLAAWLLMGVPKLPPEERTASQTNFSEGLKYLKRTPHVLSLSFVKTTNAVAGAGLVMLPIFGETMFPPYVGPVWVGVLYASRGFGALLGSMGVRLVFGDSRRAMRRSIGPGFLLVAAGMSLVAWSSSIGWAMFGFFLGAIGSGMVWIYSSTLLQLETDSAYRGRVFSLEFGVMTLTMAASCLLGGVLIDGMGWTEREVLLGVGGVLVAVGTLVASAILVTAPSEASEDVAMARES